MNTERRKSRARLTPAWARATAYGALGYFILPLDTIPDFLAIVGFTDDIAVLTAAIALAQSHITDEHREKARSALSEDDEVNA